MNEEQVQKFNSVVNKKDTVYILGDVMLGDNEEGLTWLKQLKGHITIILGNHDTEARKKLYRDTGYPVKDIETIRIKKHSFYLSHYPTVIGCLSDTDWERWVINLYGHIHQTGSNFYQDIPWMYYVGVDSHDGYPVEVNQILFDIKKQINDCLFLLC